MYFLHSLPAGSARIAHSGRHSQGFVEGSHVLTSLQCTSCCRRASCDCRLAWKMLPHARVCLFSWGWKRRGPGPETRGRRNRGPIDSEPDGLAIRSRRRPTRRGGASCPPRRVPYFPVEVGKPLACFPWLAPTQRACQLSAARGAGPGASTFSASPWHHSVSGLVQRVDPVPGAPLALFLIRDRASCRSPL
jgi:hypothetical protein